MQNEKKIAKISLYWGMKGADDNLIPDDIT